MKVIIAGGRDVEHALKQVARAIARSGWLMQITEVVSGGARGIDRAGELWAEFNQIACTPMEAAWNDLSGNDGMPVVVKTNKRGRKYNAAAGHNRNQAMADYGEEMEGPPTHLDMKHKK